MIGYLGKVTRPLILILPKWVNMLKRLDYKLLDKLKTEDWILKNIELNALPVYDDRYIAKIGTYDDDNNIDNNNNDNNNNKYYLGYFNKLVDEHDNSYHCSIIFFFFSIWVFFHEHSRFTGQQGKGEGIYLTPLYHFHPLYRHLDISRVISAESSLLHIAGSRNRTENLWFPSTSR